MNNKKYLITGGARSGKSNFAQDMALQKGGNVLFVATAEAGDEEMQRRIKKHKKSRPAEWATLETTGNIGNKIKQNVSDTNLVIIDCITMLINNIFSQYAHQTEPINSELLEKKVIDEINALTECMNSVSASFIIVTNEIGLGLVPADPSSRLFRDVLGKANQILANNADVVYLMVAGLPLRIKPE